MNTLCDIVAEAASKRPSAVALRRRQGNLPKSLRKSRYQIDEVTFEELHKQALRNAAALIENHDIQKGDRVGIIGENSPTTFMTHLGVQFAGAISVPFDYDLVPFGVNRGNIKGLTHQIEDVEPKLLLVDEHLIGSHSERIYTDLVPPLTIISRTGDTDSLFQESLEKDAQPLIEVLPTDLSMFICSSGTTADSDRDFKFAMHSHASLVANIQAGQDVLRGQEGEVYLTGLAKSSHVFEATVQLAMLSAGAIQHFTDRESYLKGEGKLVEPDYALMIPLMANRVKDQATNAIAGFVDAPGVIVRKKITKKLGPKKVTLIGGSAPLEEATQRWWMDVAKMPIDQGYGLTEFPFVSINTADAYRIKSSGQVFPGIEARVLDLETGEDITQENRAGILHLKGEGSFVGYWNRPRQTEETLAQDGFLNTGDLGRIEDGFLFIEGRAKRLIVFKDGTKLAPDTIESAYLSMNPIEYLMVTGAPGETGKLDEGATRHLYGIVIPNEDWRGRIDHGDFRDNVAWNDCKKGAMKTLRDCSERFGKPIKDVVIYTGPLDGLITTSKQTLQTKKLGDLVLSELRDLVKLYEK